MSQLTFEPPPKRRRAGQRKAGATRKKDEHPQPEPTVQRVDFNFLLASILKRWAARDGGISGTGTD